MFASECFVGKFDSIGMGNVPIGAVPRNTVFNSTGWYSMRTDWHWNRKYSGEIRKILE